MFRMYCCVEDPEHECISYLDINSLYPYVMSEIDFPLGHLEIRRGNHSCRNLLSKLRSTNKDFIGVCQVRVLPPDNLFVPCLAHKMDGKLLFCLCRNCASNGQIQRIRCSDNEKERSWIDVYASIDVELALLMGYKILEYKEIWNYHSGGGKVFRDFILNIVKRKIECSGLPPSCNSDQSKEDYVQSLKKQCSIDLRVDDIRKDPTGRYLNKIMANLVCGKWAQNPFTQSSLTTCGTIREYHERL